MLEQPAFGQRLKELRKERGLSQAALAGDAISTGYLSRLESGTRRPTEHVLSYLLEQLRVDRSAFDVPSGSSLARALSIAMSTESEEAVERLIGVLDKVRDEDPFLRWQALWLVAGYRRKRGERAEERAVLEESARIADDLALPELRCRSWTQLARCLRAMGEVPRAIELTERACALAREAKLSADDTGAALLTLVSVKAEAGRLPEARAHADELVELLAGRSDTLAAEALWSASTVRLRQGDHEAAREFIERAMADFDSHADPTLWVRLRVAAASLYLQLSPPETARARECLQAAESALPLVGTPMLKQELTMLQAQLALLEGDHRQARRLHDELSQDGLERLAYRDRMRLNILDSRLLILEGRQEEGINKLRDLGEQARQDANLSLAAEIWRVLAETLAEAYRVEG